MLCAPIIGINMKLLIFAWSVSLATCIMTADVTVPSVVKPTSSSAPPVAPTKPIETDNIMQETRTDHVIVKDPKKLVVSQQYEVNKHSRSYHSINQQHPYTFYMPASVNEVQANKQEEPNVKYTYYIPTKPTETPENPSGTNQYESQEVPSYQVQENDVQAQPSYMAIPQHPLFTKSIPTPGNPANLFHNIPVPLFGGLAHNPGALFNMYPGYNQGINPHVGLGGVGPVLFPNAFSHLQPMQQGGYYNPGLPQYIPVVILKLGDGNVNHGLAPGFISPQPQFQYPQFQYQQIQNPHIYNPHMPTPQFNLQSFLQNFLNNQHAQPQFPGVNQQQQQQHIQYKEDNTASTSSINPRHLSKPIYQESYKKTLIPILPTVTPVTEKSVVSQVMMVDTSGFKPSMPLNIGEAYQQHPSKYLNFDEKMSKT